jgi:ribonuclease HII
MKPDLWKFEKEGTENGFYKIAGIDEAGRGPLAGPVVSAAVMLPSGFSVEGITDSKKLTAKKRADLYEEIYKHAMSVGIGIVDASEIDRINILNASLLSMLMSVENLHPQPDFLLIDGQHRVSSNIPQLPIPKGDFLSISIAAASIVAKVTRDRLMDRYHHDYPQFGFCHHKGYPTRAHKTAIDKYGCCLIHRRSFRGVKEYGDHDKGSTAIRKRK